MINKGEYVKEDERVKDQDEEDAEDDEEDEEDEEDKDDGMRSTHAIVVADLNATMKPQGEREALKNSKDETRRARGRRWRPRREEE